MKNISKKSVMTSGLAITAFIAAAIVFALLLYTEKKVLATEEKISVCIAACEIPAGTDINDVTVKKYFEIKEVYVSAVPEDAMDTAKDLLDMTSVYSITEGTIITAGMFRDSYIGSRWMKEPVLLGFKVDDVYQVAGGILRTGDIVHIYIIDDTGIATLRWENVFIENAFDNTGNILEQIDEGRATRFNIFFEKEDVEEFYTSLDSGKIRIVKI